jgi:hypothetical protein
MLPIEFPLEKTLRVSKLTNYTTIERSTGVSVGCWGVHPLS